MALNASGDDSYVLCELAGTTYALRSDDIEQLEMVGHLTPVPNAPTYVKRVEQQYDAKLAARPDLYGKVIKTSVLVPGYVNPAPKGSADMVLTFRNVHNWAKAGTTEAMFTAFYDALNPAAFSA